MIRNFKKEDLLVIMDIGNRAWQGIYDMYIEAYGEDLLNLLLITSDRHTAKGQEIKIHCDKHPDWVFVCEEEGRIVGFVTFNINEEEGIAEIGNNAVDPECGLKGMGQQMYRAVLEHFRKKGIKYAKVSTGLDWAHAPARRAYEQAGFNLKTEMVQYYIKLEESSK